MQLYFRVADLQDYRVFNVSDSQRNRYTTMIKKLTCTIICLMLLFTNLRANQIDEPSRILSSIKRTVNLKDSVFYKLEKVRNQIKKVDIQEANTKFDKLTKEATSTHDEKTIYCINVLAGVYYFDRSDFPKALEYLRNAESYSHLSTQATYVKFLTGLSYMRTGKSELGFQCLDDIIKNYNPQYNDSPFCDVVYCESLRGMAEYYRKRNNDSSAYIFMSNYMTMCDTITCAYIGNNYCAVPQFIYEKYIEHRATDFYHTPSSEPANNTLDKVIHLVLISSLLISVGYTFRYKRKLNKKISNATKTADTKEPAKDTALALAPFSAIVGATTNAVSVFNPDGTFKWVNRGFEKLFGMTMNEYILAYGNNIFSCSKMKECQDAFILCSQTKTPQKYTTKAKTGYRTDIWIQGTITPIIENGLITKYIAIDTDITTLKREKQMTDSINSLFKGNLRNASDLQRTLMPSKIEISRCFENFIIYKPKEFVSGDFYWFNKLDKSYFFALGDCTGHGVSGSLLCVLSMKTLDEIVLTDKITDPKEILSTMENNISKSLKQDINENNKDGLDITICKITPTISGAEIVAAGAKSYFFYHSNNTTTMVRGSKRSIGGILPTQENYEFENVEINLKHGDYIYFSSDGIIDQNNSTRRSLGRQRFTEIIDQAAKLDILTQEEFILSKVNEWAEGEPQRDDICVAGIRI